MTEKVLTDEELRKKICKIINAHFYDENGNLNIKLLPSDIFDPEASEQTKRIVNEEFRKEISNILRKELFDEHGIYTRFNAHDLCHDLNSDDSPQVVKDKRNRELEIIISEEKNKILDYSSDYAIADLQDELVVMFDGMAINNELMKEIDVNEFYNGNNRAVIDKGFQMLSKKYKELNKVKKGKYLINLGLRDTIIEDIKIQWFFKERNTCISNFLMESEKIIIGDGLFLIPLLRKIVRGKEKGLHYYYILLDNTLRTIDIYEVTNLRYLDNKSSLYKLLKNTFPGESFNYILKHITGKAPIMAFKNLDIMNLTFKGKIGNFYRDKKLIKQ